MFQLVFQLLYGGKAPLQGRRQAFRRAEARDADRLLRVAERVLCIQHAAGLHRGLSEFRRLVPGAAPRGAPRAAGDRRAVLRGAGRYA